MLRLGSRLRGSGWRPCQGSTRLAIEACC